MSTLTLSPRPVLRALPGRDQRSTGEDSVPDVALTWHEQVASAFRAARHSDRRDRFTRQALHRIAR